MKTRFQISLVLWLLICVGLGCVLRQGQTPVAEPYNESEALMARQKWDAVKVSTSMQWVDYDADAESRSVVRFDSGVVTFEAVVALEAGGATLRAREKTAESVRRVFAAKTLDGDFLLADQVKTPEGKVVDETNVEDYIERVVLPTLEIRSRYKARDGAQRLRMASSIKMTPDHVKIRADRYRKQARHQAKRFGLDPALIMAVIYTESCFNPFARSPDGALGLMQIIPRHAGQEAYASIYKEKKIPPDDYFFNPEKNIELGAAYLHLLMRRYFGDIKQAEKRLYLTICAYNWGPTKVRQEITNQHKVAALSLAGLRTVLQKKAPQETRAYLDNVLASMEQF